MLGILLTDTESSELKYLLRKELDEMLFDLHDERIDPALRTAIEKRYHIIFRMYARIAPSKQLSQYVRNRRLSVGEDEP